MRCCVSFCTNTTENVTKTDGISFHAFPDEDSGALRALWLRSLGIQGHVPASAAVCSQHFLRDDMQDSHGETCLRARAVPVAVKVCLICLDTDSQMISMRKYNLGEAYGHLTGYSVSSSSVMQLCNEGNLRHILCIECAERLTNIIKFREKSLRARILLKDFIEKYQMITPQDIAHLRSQITLNSSEACSTLGSDPSDLHMLDGTYAQTELQLGSCSSLDMPQARESADGDSVDIIRQIAMLDKAHFNRQLYQHHSVLKCWVKLTRMTHLEDTGSYKNHAVSSSGETSLVSVGKTVPDYALQLSLASDNGAKGYCYDQSQQVFDEIGEISSNNNSKTNGQQDILTPSINQVRSNSVSNLALKNCFVLLDDIFKESNRTVSKQDGSLTKKRTTFTHESNTQRKGTYTRDLPCDKSTSHSEVSAQESIVNNVRVDKTDLTKAVQSETVCSNIVNKLQCEEMPATNKDSYIFKNDFRGECGLLKHLLLTHAEEKLFSCELCKYSAKSKSKLVIHMETHKSEKSFTCKLCQYKCTTKSSFIKHKREHSLQKRYACNLCDYKNANSGNLKRHMVTHGTAIHTGEKPYACNVCLYKANCKFKLVIHLRKHTGEKPFACTLCQFKSGYRSNLVTHMGTHGTEKTFACHLCEYKSAVKANLQRHMKVHTSEKPHACQVCPYKSNSISNLVQHMRKHTGEKPYACTVCPRRFGSRRNLLFHAIIHTGEKLNACKLCHFKSLYKANLDTHMLTHTGESKLTCNSCQAKFASKYSLTKHMNAHTSEKPFSCKFCQYKCMYSNQLAIHVRTHTGEKPYVCKVCHFKCTTSGYLLIHMKLHTGERPYAC